MASTASASKGKRPAPASNDKYRKVSKKVKTELSKEEKLQKRWHSLKDQVQDGHLQNALKTSQRILDLDPENEHAYRTHIQILLSLDRYKDTLAFIDAQSSLSDSFKLERCYALYKTGRVPEAAELLEAIRAGTMQLDANDDLMRSIDILDAQIKYRLEQFDQARDLYEDLLATVETDSPEHTDLSANLAACNEYLEFMQSIPARLAELSSDNVEASHRLQAIESLETAPVQQLINAHPAYQTRSAPGQLSSASTSKGLAAPTSGKTRSTKKKDGATKQGTKKSGKLPASIAALPEGQRPAPDPERWLPKRERKGYIEVLAAKEREKEKRRLKARKKLEATLTQGTGSAGNDESAGKAQASASGSNASASAKNKSKKKKGGR